MSQDWKDMLAGLDLPESQAEAEPTPETSPKSKNKSVTLFFERKGRAGKSATILADFSGIDREEITALASELKQRLGCGGSERDGEILIQGDRRQDLRKLMSDRGFKVKG